MTKRKKLFLYICLGIQLFILLFYAVSYFVGKDCVYNVDYHDLVGTTIPDDRGGWYIDETFPCLEDGLFDYTVDMEMTRGIYRVTVNYETDTNNCYSTVAASTVSPLSLRVDKVPFPAELCSVTYDVYLLTNTEDFRVQNYYAKEGYLIVRDINIVKTRLLPRVMFFSWFIIFILVDFGIYVMAVKKKSLRIHLFIFIGAVLASVPLLDTGVPFGIDCNFHLLRIEGLVEGIRGGQFPVKLQTNWIYGYGYATSLYYGDLFLMIPAMLRMIGYSVQFSYKCLLFITNLATMGIMYWCTYKISRHKLIAYSCALIYLLIPFRLYDMYPRAGLGEAIALAFYPLIAYGFFMIFTMNASEENIKKMWIPLVIGFTGIIESHMLSCVMCAEFAAIACVINIKKVLNKERFFVLLKAVIYTIGFNAWFVFPCITSLENMDIVQPYRKFLTIQDVGLQWTDLFGRPDIYKSAGITLGLALLVFLYAITKPDVNRQLLIQGMQMFGLTVVSLWATTMYFPWDRLTSLLGSFSSLVTNVQFPWRYMGVATTVGVFTVCIGLMILKDHLDSKMISQFTLGLIVVSILTANWLLLDKEAFDTRTVYDMDATGNTRWYVDEYVYCVKPNNTVQEYLENRVKSGDLIAGNIFAEDNVLYSNYTQIYTESSIDCINQNDYEAYIELPLLYYKQYEAECDTGDELEIHAGKNSVLRLVLPPHFSGHIVVSFKHQLSWRIFELISLGFIVFAIVKGIAFKHRETKNAN